MLYTLLCDYLDLTEDEQAKVIDEDTQKYIDEFCESDLMELTDLTEEDLKKGCYTLVPLTLLVDGEEIIDDETFDQADFLAKVAASKESVKSACPAPESYMEAYS